MKHSRKLSEKLIKEHFEPYMDGPIRRYRPKTAIAHDHWRHTGVCPNCLARSISAGRCDCGWRANDK